jgi:prevent-host-death family protein
MRTISSSEAKTHFAQLLDEVEKGETITITRHGRVIAQLLPDVQAKQERKNRAYERILELRKHTKKVTVEEILAWRDEGRKY